MAEAATTEAPAGAEPEVITVDQVADLVAPLPDVNQDAIAVEHAPQPAAVPNEGPKPPPPQAGASAAGGAQRTGAAGKQPRSAPAPVDMFGRSFDPRLHETTADGKPVISTSGKRMGKIRCRRQPLKEYTQESTIGDQPEAAAAGDEPQPAAEPDAETVALQRKVVAQTIAGAQLLLMRMALGSDVGAEKEQRDGLIESWEAIVAYHDVRTFNPWLGLVITSGAIVVANMHKPTVADRLHQLTSWAKLKAYALWLRITGRRARAETQRREGPAAAAA